MQKQITQGVHTVYFGPGNVRGARIRAKAWCGTMWLHYDHKLTPEKAHIKAAQEFFDAKGWKGEFVSGGDAEGRGYYHVMKNEG